MSWTSSTLGELINLNYGKGLPEIKRVEGDVPVYGSGGIIGFHKEALIEGPGIIVGRKGTVGSVYWEGRNFFPIDTSYYVTPKSGKSNLKFIYYLLKSLPLASLNTDAAVPGLNRDNALRLKIKLPSKPIQDRIAEILSAYDSLIENNRRRIQLLEQSARLLYREWFVHLRFPGHEHVRIIDGVPEGWEVKQLSELCHIARGASPRPINDYMGGNVPWFKIGDATASESPFVFETKEKVTEDGAIMSRTLPPGSFILSNSATCGIPYFTGVEGCIHDGWLCFWDFKRINKFFLYCFLHFKQRELLTIVCDGSTQKNLNTNIVGGLRVLLPMQNELMNIFLETVNPVFDMLFTLSKENIAVRKARDILLPRLMNGEITV